MKNRNGDIFYSCERNILKKYFGNHDLLCGCADRYLEGFSKKLRLPIGYNRLKNN